MISLSGLSAVPTGYAAGLDVQAKLAELARQQAAQRAAGLTLQSLAGGQQQQPPQDGVSPLIAALQARGATNVQPTVSPNAPVAPDNSFNGRFEGAPAPQQATVPPQMQGMRPGSLSRDFVVRSIAQANPGIAPDALAATVSTLTPLMNADSQERWKALDAQLRARQLDLAGRKADATGLSASGQKPPPGYRYTADGSRLEPIPGGPKAGDPMKARNTLDTLTRQWGVVGSDIDRAISAIDQGIFPRTGAGSLVSGVPGTPQHDLANLLNTIKANIGFEQLAQMRAASPTGGALGQVSDFENKLLQAVQGALEQSQTADQLKFNLKRVKTLLGDTLREKQQAYDMDFGGQAADTPTGGDVNTSPMFGGEGDQGGLVEGDTATGPNGQQIILRNGKWVAR